MAKVKICGITCLEDYEAAQRLGVEFTGFIFYFKGGIRPNVKKNPFDYNDISFYFNFVF